AALVGGTMAAGSHFTKAGTRLMINTSPEPVTNWTASIAEDLAVIAGLWAALNHPVAFILLLALFIAMVIWLLPKIWRALKSLFRRIGALFAKEPPPPDSPLGSKSEHPDVLKSLFHSANSDQGMEK
ncbi:MAG: DUF4126 domain-containing protein, partial [Candidatus Thiodiazotropha sp. (ex Codakia orbicularis)]|nr:DUF4126 domain-containing protein [Candidatus Thiodiazotropha sp. (ex Codakia orbicularis)]